MKNLQAIIAVIAIVFLWCWIIYRIYLSYNQPTHTEIENLNNECQLIVQKHNEVNHKLNEANSRIEELKAANEVLIKVCNPSDFHNVAERTPLPKLVRI